jgi:pilus assembly protein CpaE
MLTGVDWQMQKKVRVLIAGDNSLLTERLRAFLDQGHQTQPIGVVANGRECLEVLRNRAPDVLLIVDGLAGENVLDICREAVHIHPRIAPVILAANQQHQDPKYLHQALNLGVCDVLHADPPYTDLRFQSVIDSVVQAYNLMQERINGIGGGIGRVITFFSLKGGVGKTTLAANLAWLLSTQDEQRVMLADFNWHFGSLDATLGHVADQSILDLIPVLDGISRIDLENIAPPINDRLRLLCAPLDTERPGFTRDLIERDVLEDERSTLIDTLLTQARHGEAIHIGHSQLNFLEVLLRKEKTKQILSVLARRTIQSLRRNYHYIVTDTGTRLDDVTLTTLELSDMIVLVCTPDVPSIRATRAAMTLFAELGIAHERIVYVLNRVSRRAEIRVNDVRSLFSGYELIGEIPADFESLQPFVNCGALLAASVQGTAVTRALSQLAARVVAHMPPMRVA